MEKNGGDSPGVEPGTSPRRVAELTLTVLGTVLATNMN